MGPEIRPPTRNVYSCRPAEFIDVAVRRDTVVSDEAYIVVHTNNPRQPTTRVRARIDVMEPELQLRPAQPKPCAV